MKWIIGATAIVVTSAILLVGYCCLVVGARADRKHHNIDKNK